MIYTNKDIVHLLKSAAAALLLTNENRFRIIAYQKAADAVEGSSQEVFEMWKLGKLADIEGIGPSLQQHLNEYFTKPEGSYLEKQLAKVPATVYELMKAPGIGPKKAYKIVMTFKLFNLDTVVGEIHKLAAKNKIAELEGFGEKSQQDILDALKIHENRKDQEERMSLPIAFTLAQDVQRYLLKNKHVQEVNTLGSLRRMNATIGDVDVVAVAEKKYADEIIEHFTNYPEKISIEGKGDEKASIITAAGRRVDLRVVEKERYGSMLQYFTGSKAHNIKLREYGLRKGFSLNEFGIKKGKSKAGQGRATDFSFDSEEKFYEFLGLQWVPPELREGNEEVLLAAQKKLPELVELSDIKGEFHIHSSFDVEESHDPGTDSMVDMIKKAQELGYTYLAFSEHNPSISKHTDDQIIRLIKRKNEAVKALNEKLKDFTCINSLEVDILPDGRLALPDEAFQYLDMIVVSVHSSFTQPNEKMTERILRGLSYPKVRVFGHPTARLLGKREGVQADWDTIFDFCSKKNIALEINSATSRLDLPELLVRAALKRKNIFSIDTDAHEVSGMDAMHYGVAVARRGWCQKSDIINTQPISAIKKWLEI
jgi:DNA polymerase (family 10)